MAYRGYNQGPYDHSHSQPQNTFYDEQRQGFHYNHPQSRPNDYSQPQRVRYQQQYAIMGDHYPQKPQLGASYIPSAFDDYYMPSEVVSPTPQRIMPEVPSNMQQGLANLELEARNSQGHRVSSASTVSSMQSPYVEQNRTSLQRPSLPGFTASYEHTNASAYQNINKDQYGGAEQGQDSPKFNPFPKLRNPGPNVPLSDEDKEEVLERARPLVLKATDPEMQLAWAQDALSWVEVASQNSNREQSGGQPARSNTPKVEHQLRVDALNIVEFLAGQQHPKAEFMKGWWLEFGKFGYRVDKKEAFLGYRRAAEKGYARAEYRIGMQYESSNNLAKAVEHYQKGVALKDSASNYRLGMMTLLGQHGMQQDYHRGVDLVRFAADTADENAPQGAYVYGMLLARELPNINVPDQFLPFDLNLGALFIEKAAYLGFAKAQLKMAQAYELCQLGCEFDPALSLHYNALAARQGEAEADMAISKWFLCGYEGVFEKNEELAFTYARRAAQTKMATAEFAMGYFYEIGMYVPVDIRESEIWYQKAAEHGNKDAVQRIDSIKKNNTLTKDHQQVAISRIKSQYGSQRGARPDRFRQKPAPMGAMAEEEVSMPDSRYSYAGAGAASLRPDKNLPPRPGSSAPYPDDDAHIPGASNSFNNQSLRPKSSSGPQADRPSSAFGVRPAQQAKTDTGNKLMTPPPLEGRRPQTSAGSMQVPGSLGSNPSARERVTSTGWEPQLPAKYREPSPNRAPTLPPIDLGRPANFDQVVSSRLQKPLPPNMNKPHPSPPMPSAGYETNPYTQQASQQSYNTAIPRRDPAGNQYSRPERGSSMTPVMSPPIVSQPQINQPRPESMTPQGPHRASPRPSQHTMSSQSADSRPPSVAPSVALGASSGPPKKQGPSTFEAMGIPSAKAESDCIIM